MHAILYILIGIYEIVKALSMRQALCLSTLNGFLNLIFTVNTSGTKDYYSQCSDMVKESVT